MPIRPRDAEDLPTLAAILQETHEHDAYPVRREAVSIGWLTLHDGPAWVLEVDGSVVGQVALDRASDDGPWEICRYFVSPMARGKGGAAQLLKHALAHASATGRETHLVVMSHNKAAISLYERLGWQRDVEAAEDGFTDAEGNFHRLLRYRAPTTLNSAVDTE